MDLPTSVEQTHALLQQGGYIADRSLATALYLALSLKRPLFLEGEAGVVAAFCRDLEAGATPKVCPKTTHFSTRNRIQKRHTFLSRES